MNKQFLNLFTRSRAHLGPYLELRRTNEKGQMQKLHTVLQLTFKRFLQYTLYTIHTVTPYSKSTQSKYL